MPITIAQDTAGEPLQTSIQVSEASDRIGGTEPKVQKAYQSEEEHDVFQTARSWSYSWNHLCWLLGSSVQKSGIFGGM